MNLYLFKAVGSYFGGAVGIVAESESDVLAVEQEAQDNRAQDYPRFGNELFSFKESPKRGWLLFSVVSNVNLPRGVHFEEWHEG